jgi:hypothetical protein
VIPVGLTSSVTPYLRMMSALSVPPGHQLAPALTLSDPQLNGPKRINAFEVLRSLREEVRGKDLLYDPAPLREGKGETSPSAIGLQEIVCGTSRAGCGVQ